MTENKRRTLVREYDDGPGSPVDGGDLKELAYRQGFVEEAHRIVREWADPPMPPTPDPEPDSLRQLIEQQPCDPFGEAEAAWQLRRRVRERYAVYGPGDAGRKTYHLGFRSGHSLAAARLRGRHHAMVHVIEPWHHGETSDVDIFDPHLLNAWWRAVQRWAAKPIRPGVISPPPRVLACDCCGEYEPHGSPPPGAATSAGGWNCMPRQEKLGIGRDQADQASDAGAIASRTTRWRALREVDAEAFGCATSLMLIHRGPFTYVLGPSRIWPGSLTHSHLKGSDHD